MNKKYRGAKSPVKNAKNAQFFFALPLAPRRPKNAFFRARYIAKTRINIDSQQFPFTPAHPRPPGAKSFVNL